jgi:hypothetical protein
MHPKLLESTVAQCRAYMEAGDCHGEALPTERLIAAVVQLGEQLDAADEQINQLARALRAEVEPPTFMGEPVSTRGVPLAHAPEPCPRGKDKPEHSCTNRHQCWEPCGELGKSAEHARPGRTDPETVKRILGVKGPDHV